MSKKIIEQTVQQKHTLYSKTAYISYITLEKINPNILCSPKEVAFIENESVEQPLLCLKLFKLFPCTVPDYLPVFLLGPLYVWCY